MDKEQLEQKQRLEDFVSGLQPWTGNQQAVRGIVICGGGVHYLPGVWVILQQLRSLGCKLPVEIWYLGPMETSEEILQLFTELGAAPIDAYKIAGEKSINRLRGWELKVFALMHSRFTQALLLDADNLPLQNPESFFEWPEFLETHALFWPDVYAPWAKPWLKPETWEICGIPFHAGPEFESGQVLLDKRYCWEALQLTYYFNQHSDYYYQYFYGDKDTFQLAWLKCGTAFALVPHRPQAVGNHAIVQFDFLRRALMLHRNRSKWKLRNNLLTPGFALLEHQCLQWLEELQSSWNGAVNDDLREYPQLHFAFMEITSAKTYRYILKDHGEKLLELMPDFTLFSQGNIRSSSPAIMETGWRLEQEPDGNPRLVILNNGGPTCFLNRDDNGNWRGRWLSYERMEVFMEPIYASCTAEEQSHYYALQEDLIRSFPFSAPPGNGKGIVIAGGGKYFAAAWVLIHLLRNTLHCALPIELWHLTEEEIPAYTINKLQGLGVIFRNPVEEQNQPRIEAMNGWTLKSYALVNSSFAEVLLLDADNVPLRDPSFLFDDAGYKETAAVFWPDFGALSSRRVIWKVCGIDYRHEPEFESGQLLVNRSLRMDALRLALFYNEHRDFYYRLVNGDKETFHLAWLRLALPYSMIPTPVDQLPYTMLQHDPSGKPLFQHRYGDKWKEQWDHINIPGFVFEQECLGYLRLLQQAGNRRMIPEQIPLSLQQLHDAVCRTRYFEYERVGHDKRLIEFLPGGDIGEGRMRCEQRWFIREAAHEPILEIEGEEGLICRARPEEKGIWRGHWTKFEQMEVILQPINR